MSARELVMDNGDSTDVEALSRVLIVHNFYRVRGGEDEQVDREVAVLREAGVEVRLLSAHSSEMSPVDLARLWLSLGFCGGKRSREIGKTVREWNPDLVHVHNTFPMLTPDAIRASVRSGASTLVTLHNYRVFCANGVCLRAGRECTKCATSPRFFGVPYRCYRRSAILSAWVHALGVWLRRVLRLYQPMVVAPSEYAAAMVAQCIGGRSSVGVLPNIVLPSPEVELGHRMGAAYIGRLSSEKGLDDLIEAWKRCASSSHAVLTIAGDGPLRSSLDAVACVEASVRVVGPLQAAERDELLRSSAVCVVPSRVPETFGLVAAEAALAGCPLIVTECGALPATMGGSDCGLLVAPGDAGALAQAIDRVLDHPQEARVRAERARAHVTRSFLPGAFLTALVRCTTESARTIEGGSPR